MIKYCKPTFICNVPEAIRFATTYVFDEAFILYTLVVIIAIWQLMTGICNNEAFANFAESCFKVIHKYWLMY